MMSVSKERWPFLFGFHYNLIIGNDWDLGHVNTRHFSHFITSSERDTWTGQKRNWIPHIRKGRLSWVHDLLHLLAVWSLCWLWLVWLVVLTLTWSDLFLPLTWCCHCCSIDSFYTVQFWEKLMKNTALQNWLANPYF